MRQPPGQMSPTGSLPDQRGDDGERHGEEHLSFYPGQREDRQIYHHDDQLPEDHRPARLLRGREHDLEALGESQGALQTMLLLRQWRMQFSTMITAPSTMIPKSRAPRLIRLR